MLHRIFLAINLPNEIKDFLKNYQEEFREIPAKWVKPENLHITLLFLGNIKADFLPKIFQICETLSKKFQKFHIELEKIDFFPKNTFPPQMIWVFVKKSETLDLLQKSLREELIKNHVPFHDEEREFFPHITLARIKKFEFRRLDPDEIPEIKREISLSFEAESIDVMESHLKRDGPQYYLLKSYPFS